MSVNVDELALNIKAEIRGERRDEMRYMVDELVRTVKELEAIVEPLHELLDDGECKMDLYRNAGDGSYHAETVFLGPFTRDSLAEVLQETAKAKREAGKAGGDDGHIHKPRL